jgi:hypothetical protein
MEKSLQNARQSIESLYTDRKRHPITYNHYFTRNIQKSFNDCMENKMQERLKQIFPIYTDQ